MIVKLAGVTAGMPIRSTSSQPAAGRRLRTAGVAVFS